MKYTLIKDLNDEKFRRLTGVKQTTFNKMVGIIKEANYQKKARSGRRNKLYFEGQLFMSLEYIREYRNCFHMSQSYGLSESSTDKAVKFVKDTLIKHPDFALPGHKALVQGDVEYEVILMDATESPIEPPKKRKNSSTLGRKKDIL